MKKTNVQKYEGEQKFGKGLRGTQARDQPSGEMCLPVTQETVKHLPRPFLTHASYSVKNKSFYSVNSLA